MIINESYLFTPYFLYLPPFFGTLLVILDIVDCYLTIYFYEKKETRHF